MVLDLLLQLFFGIWAVEGGCAEVIALLILGGVAVVLICKG